MTAISTILLVILTILLASIVECSCAINRAFKTTPCGVKRGMVIDKRCRLCLTKTLVYRDYKTGLKFTGKPMIDGENK